MYQQRPVIRNQLKPAAVVLCHCKQNIICPWKMQQTFRWFALRWTRPRQTDENVHLLYGYEMSASHCICCFTMSAALTSVLNATNITLTRTFSGLKDHDLCVYKYSTVFDSFTIWFYFRLFYLWLASSSKQWMQTFLKRRRGGRGGSRQKRPRGEREHDREHEREMKKERERRRGGETSLPILSLLLSPQNQPLILASDSAKLISGRQGERKGRKRVETLEAAARSCMEVLHLVKPLT